MRPAHRLAFGDEARYQRDRRDDLDRRARQAAGTWVHDLAPWTHWATLTFRRDVGSERAHRVIGTIARRVARTTRTHVPIAWGSGAQASGRVHHHLLLAVLGDERETDSLVETAVHAADDALGRVQLDRFDAQRGAAWYATTHPSWDLNFGCPKLSRACRRTSCAIARGPL